MQTAEWLLVAWSLAILATDLAVRRIPNVYSIGGALLALGCLLVTGQAWLGDAGWLAAMAGAGLALALTLPGYFARLLGAGDVKLLFAIGLLGGWQAVLFSFITAGLLSGGVITGALLLAR